MKQKTSSNVRPLVQQGGAFVSKSHLAKSIALSLVLGVSGFVSSQVQAANYKAANDTVNINTTYGNVATASGIQSVAVGGLATAGADYTIAVGQNAKANSASEVVVGRSAGSGATHQDYSLILGTAAGQNADGTTKDTDEIRASVIEHLTPEEKALEEEAKEQLIKKKIESVKSGQSGRNLYMGYQAGYSSNGGRNTFIGPENTGMSAVGDLNIGIGLASLLRAKGNENTAVGAYSGQDTNGRYNTSLGTASGKIVTGDENTALGGFSGQTVTGNYNSAVGTGSGNDVTGNNNIAMGNQSGSTVVGSGNTAMGTYAGFTVKGDNNTAVGINSGRFVTGTDNIAIGDLAGIYVTGKENITLGLSAAFQLQGDYNLVFGHNAGVYTKEKLKNNIIMGTDAGMRLKGSNNTAIGLSAGQLVNGSNNMVLGTSSGLGLTGLNNVAVGTSSGTFMQGNLSIAIGNEAGFYMQNATKKGDTLTRVDTGVSEYEGNVAIGNRSGNYIKGDGNVFLGGYAGTVTRLQQGIGEDYTKVRDKDQASVSVQKELVGAIAIGAQSVVTGNGNIALGYHASSISVQKAGEQVPVPGEDGKTVEGDPAIIAGSTENNIAFGYKARANASKAANTERSIAFGYQANVDSATSAIAIGDAATTVSDKTIVIGSGSTTVAQYDTDGTVAKDTGATGSIAIGAENTIDEEHVVALGNKITKTAANSVFLGKAASYVEATTATAPATTDGTADAATEGAPAEETAKAPTITDTSRTAGLEKTYTLAKIGDTTYKFAGGDQVAGVVSVGSGTETRRIQNVAPGFIGANSTDAINGSQLYAAMNAPVFIYSGGSSNESKVYSRGTQVKTTGDKDYTISNLSFAFTDGLQAETVTENGKDIVKVGMTKVYMTKLDDAIKGATDATNAANTAAEKANTAAGNADTAASAANQAAGKADGAANAANTAAGEANKATGAANDAATNATKAATGASEAAGKANEAATNAGNAAVKANEAADNANKAAERVNNAIGDMKGSGIEAGDVHGTKDSLAAGKGSDVKADEGTAIGNGAKVTDKATNSVAIGAGSVADRPNTVSVGSEGHERVITNVAPGLIAKDSTDAVNGGQLYEVAQQVGNNSQAIRDLRRDSRKGDAMNAALAALKPIAYNPAEPTQIMAGIGTYRGEQAVALGAAHYVNGRTMLNAGVAYAGSSNMMANVGVTWRVGQGEVPEDKAVEADKAAAELNSRVQSLEQTVNEQREQIEKLMALLQAK